jgi:hypothetical protein
MDELELLMSIKSDVSAIRAYNVATDRRLKRHDDDIKAHDTRLRRVEVVFLPISAGIGWIALQLTHFLNK